MIPAEAVQAARLKLEDVLGGWFDDLDAVRKILEAAVPHMLADAFEQGQKSGTRHADRLRAAQKIGKPELPGPISPNPYRPTA